MRARSRSYAVGGFLWVLVSLAGPLTAQSNEEAEPIDPEELRASLIEAGLPEAWVVVYDTPPVLTNVDDVTQTIRRNYPKFLRDDGIGGRVELFLNIDADGRVVQVMVATASEYIELDRAAREVAFEMEFEPGRLNEKPLAVWVTQWLSFAVR